MFTTSPLRTAVGATAIVLLTATPALALGPFLRTDGLLSDLAPAAVGPFDGARARVQLVESAKGTHAVLRVEGIDATAEGQTFGAHLHDGPCVAGNGGAAGPHYNAHVHGGVTPAQVNRRTEVWLDFTVVNGRASAHAVVPFVPEAGARSVVIHAQPTDASGAAGPRVACKTVSW